MCLHKLIIALGLAAGLLGCASKDQTVIVDAYKHPVEQAQGSTIHYETSSLVKQASSKEAGVSNKTTEQAYNDAMAAQQRGDDPEAIANLAKATGVSVEQLAKHADQLFGQNHEQVDSRAPKHTQAASTNRDDDSVQQEQNPVANRLTRQQTADSIYQQALTIRHIGHRRAMLREAAQLGSKEAKAELRFY